MQSTFNSFNLLNRVKLNINILSNPFGFEMNDLFLLGARVNPKRSFLFISKLLGKHLAVHPDIPKLSGHLLANLFANEAEHTYVSDVDVLVNAVKTGNITQKVKQELAKQLPLSQEVLFLGFAETATGLGHAVFSAFQNAYYVHTTREHFIDRQSIFDFEEEHSHATEHLCYLKDKTMLKKVSYIVLIDDEITTGNTCLNLIRSLNEIYPGKQYTILSLLDWRTEKHQKDYDEFCNKYELNIKTFSLLRGTIELVKNHVFHYPGISFESLVDDNPKSYQLIYESFGEKVEVMKEQGAYEECLLGTGRFGLSSIDAENIEEEAKRIGQHLQKIRKGSKTLCIGNGEFIYIPSRISSYMGEGVDFKSSTRSPIYIANEEDYPIRDCIEYQLENGVTNYLYNLKDSGYDQAVFFVEGSMDNQTMQAIHKGIQSRGIPEVIFVVL